MEPIDCEVLDRSRACSGLLKILSHVMLAPEPSASHIHLCTQSVCVCKIKGLAADCFDADESASGFFCF